MATTSERPVSSRRLAGVLQVAGLLMLLVLVGWVILHTRMEVQDIQPWTGASALSVDATEPKAALVPPGPALEHAQQEGLRGLYEQAHGLASAHAAHSRQAASWAQWAEWLAFGLSSLLMLVAGYFGRLPEPGGEAVVAARALKAVGAGRRARRAVASRGGFAALVGLIAALSATATGASNRLQARAAAHLESAKVVSEAVARASRASASGRGGAELDDAVQQLRQAMLLHTV